MIAVTAEIANLVVIAKSAKIDTKAMSADVVLTAKIAEIVEIAGSAKFAVVAEVAQITRLPALTTLP